MLFGSDPREMFNAQVELTLFWERLKILS